MTTDTEGAAGSAGRMYMAGGPYDSAGSRFVGAVPKPLRSAAVEAGGILSLLVRIVVSAVRHPVGYWGDVLDDMHHTIRQTWLPVSVSVFGFLIFVSNLSVQFLAMVGAQQLFGPILFLESTRSFTIWINSMVVAGVIGASLTADVGARKVREELDAMEVMGVDPVRDIALPRVVSLTLITTLMSIPSLVVTLVAMQMGATYVSQLPADAFYSNVFDQLTPLDVISVVVVSLLMGLMIGAICCYKGFAADGGAIGLGRAVNQAVVQSFLGVWILLLAYHALLLGLFPGLGGFR